MQAVQDSQLTQRIRHGLVWPDNLKRAHTHTQKRLLAFGLLNVLFDHFSPNSLEPHRLDTMIKGLVGYELLKVLYNGL